MGALLLEALLALVILVFIVWWTMFSGRPQGEAPPAPENKADDLPAPKD
jgi:hypothetical protein